MKKLISIISPCLFILFSSFSYAQEVEKVVEVGKHATLNTDAPTMILSLLLVLLVVVGSAFILKKFQVTTQGTTALKVVTSLHLGTKEKIIVVQVGDKQHLLGVTATQITKLDTLEQPIELGKDTTQLFDNSVVSMLKKSMKKNA